MYTDDHLGIKTNIEDWFCGYVNSLSWNKLHKKGLKCVLQEQHFMSTYKVRISWLGARRKAGMIFRISQNYFISFMNQDAQE